MKVHKLKLAIAAGALVAAPVAAQSAGALDLRVSAPVAGANALGGESEIAPALIIGALAAIGIGILLLTDDDEDPVSA